MIAGSDLASSMSFLALSGFMFNSLATCSTLFSSIIWHLHFRPVIRICVTVIKILLAYFPDSTVTTVSAITIPLNRIYCFSNFLVCYFFLLHTNNLDHSPHLCF